MPRWVFSESPVHPWTGVGKKHQHWRGVVFPNRTAIQHYTIWSLWVCLPWLCDTLSGDLDIGQCAAGRNWHKTRVAAFQQWCFANEGWFENAAIAEWKTALEKDSVWAWMWMPCVKIRSHSFSTHTQRFTVSYWLLISLQPFQIYYIQLAEKVPPLLRRWLVVFCGGCSNTRQRLALHA